MTSDFHENKLAIAKPGIELAQLVEKGAKDDIVHELLARSLHESSEQIASADAIGRVGRWIDRRTFAATSSAVQRSATIGVLLAIKFFVGLQSWIVRVAELAGLFIRYVITRLGTFAPGWMLAHDCLPEDASAARTLRSINIVERCALSSAQKTVFAMGGATTIAASPAPTGAKLHARDRAANFRTAPIYPRPRPDLPSLRPSFTVQSSAPVMSDVTESISESREAETSQAVPTTYG